MNPSLVLKTVSIEESAPMEHKNKRRSYLCAIRGEGGHNRRSCPQLLMARKRRPYTCQYCEDNGHVANRCPLFFALEPLQPPQYQQFDPSESLKRQKGKDFTLNEKRIILHVLFKLLQGEVVYAFTV